jgi:Ca2+-transporting ATPase
MRRPIPAGRLVGLARADRGLDEAEAADRRAAFGANDIVETPPRAWRDLMRDTARDPMIWFLVGTSLLFGATGDYAEALVLLAATMPLIGMDAYLHRRTQASTTGLRGRMAIRARVVREGAVVEIPSRDLVPGDLVLVVAGESFPADGVIVEGDGLQVDESSLTGEALPVRKRPLMSVSPDGSSVDEVHWGLAGTRQLTGAARFRVIFTGAETVYSQIVLSALCGSHESTPLQMAIRRLVASLLVAATGICLLLAAARLMQGYGPVDALLSAVTLAVAALPEEFPVVFTAFLGLGVYRLAKRQALVRRAVVVENIGRVTCICSDKTGTITEGRLRVAHAFAAAGTTVKQLYAIAARASRRDSNDPLDEALLDAAPEATGVHPIAVFTFTEDSRRETMIVQDRAGSLAAAMKGAPETVLSMSTLDDAERSAWLAKVEDLARTGHKIIACATRDLSGWSGAEPVEGYVLAGLIACEDPVRPGVAEALRDCRKSGIHVIMVTGDHPVTAAAVAREIGLGADAPTVIEGQDLERRLLRNGVGFTREIHVVARAMPAQKLGLVRALQRAGELVAATGDGINDVPALQAADVGIAMGERGAQATREVASIVLMDDNFRTIVRAISEGRQLFRNLRLSFAYLLMIHIPLVLTAGLIPLAGYPLLYLPIHIVWLELIIHPTALLVFQELPPRERLGRLEAPGRRALHFFTTSQSLIIGAIGVAITLVLITGYARSLGATGHVDHARTMALVSLVVASATITAAMSAVRTQVARIVVILTLGSAVLFVQTPALAAAFHLSPLHFDDWLIAALGGVLPAVLSIPVSIETK